MPYTAAQLTQFYVRVNQGQAPDTATANQLASVAQQNMSGTLSDALALQFVLNSGQARATTDVATSTYAFFTGSIPTQAGVDYLINNPGSGFNTSYYNGTGAGASATSPGPGGFNLENRYFNSAINLGANPVGAGFSTFQSTYGSLTLQQTVATAYEAIVGQATVGQANATAAISAISASIPYFQAVASQRAPQLNQDLAAKAIIVGYIIEEAIKADVGAYAKAIDQLNGSLAVGDAAYGVNLLQNYGPNGAEYGLGAGFNTFNGAAPLASGQTYSPPIAGQTAVSTTGVASGGFATVNLGANATIVFSGDIATNNGQLFANVAGAAAGANDSLNLSYRNQTISTVSSVVADGVEGIAVNAQRTGTAPANSTLTLDLSDAALKTLTITGNETVIFTAATYPVLVNGQFAAQPGALTSVSAQTATAAAVIDVIATGGTAAVPVIVRGSAQADTISFANSTNVAGGGGNDTFKVQAASSLAAISSVTDEHAGNIFAFQSTAGLPTAVTGFTATAIATPPGGQLQDFLNAAANKAVGAVSYFALGGDTYLVQDNSPGAATFQAGIDEVVKLVGIHDLSGSTVSGGALVTGG